MRLRTGLAAVALVLAVGGALLLLRRPVWPDASAPLALLPFDAPESFGRRRIAIDPGHGAADNTGNRSAFCVAEEDFTLALAEDLKRGLEATGHFEVHLTRRAGERVEYDARVVRMQEWGADLLISLHSDVRGRAEPWEPRSGLSCQRSRSEPGYAIIFSDDGPQSDVAPRHAVARALGESFEQAGFLPYSGRSYALDYAPATTARGVFVDRRAPGARIFLLRAPRIPSVLIETHNALDDREARRWDEPRTRTAFAAAVARALGSALPAHPKTARRY